MKSTQEMKTILQLYKPRLFKDYPLKSMAIFGSFSRNDQGLNSDIDILVEFNDKIGVRFIDLAEEIEQLVGLKVDLVSRKGIKDKYFQTIYSDLIYV